MTETKNILASIRNLHGRPARGALATAMVAWLGFLLQPCVMAATMSGTGNDAKGVELSIVTHHGTGMPAERCLHCEGSTDLLPADCDDIVASGNTPTANPLDTGADGGSAVAPALFPDVRLIASGLVAPLRTGQLPPPVAFTEAYCVYLE